MAIYSGALYGVTAYGGADLGGTVFKLDLSKNTESVLDSFTNFEDGGDPDTLINSGGKLYAGTLTGGGSAGTIADIGAASHTEKTRYVFGLEAQGPTTLFEIGGTFYGIAGAGANTPYSSNSTGAIFSLAPGAKRETLLYTLSGADGYEPNSLINANGMFYGTTDFGGANGGGTLFQFNPSTNKFTTIYAFNAYNGTDGNHPGRRDLCQRHALCRRGGGRRERVWRGLCL